MRITVMLLQCLFVAMLVNSQPFNTCILAGVLNGILIGIYGGLCHQEGVTAGKKQAGRELRGP